MRRLFFVAASRQVGVSLLVISTGASVETEVSTGASLVAACGFSDPVACGILVLQSGIKLASPALEGGFLTTGLPGKSQLISF